jgi:hypothetical protein
MATDEPRNEWITLEDNEPLPDRSREMAAYERERPRLARDHLGKIAVIHGDDLVGVYDNFDDAVLDACNQFGSWMDLIFVEITASDEPEYMPHVDINHPSFQRDH